MPSYQQWKAERRAMYLKSTGNPDQADLQLAYDIIDTDNCLPMGTAQTAVAVFRAGTAKGRADVSNLKSFCRGQRSHLGGLALPDLVRRLMESVFDAVEELSEAEE